MPMKTRQQISALPVYGVDTETYSEPTFGLKSIQISGPEEEMYFTSSDFTQSDDAIRTEIATKFAQYIRSIKRNVIFAFYNLKFDFSQVLKDFLQLFNYTDDPLHMKVGSMTILETDLSLYSVKIRTSARSYVVFMDIANFLTGGAGLDTACREWLGKGKVAMESKRFPKAPSTDQEIAYAMEDARLTRELFMKLDEEGVVQNKEFVTIASRTMADFQSFIRSKGWKFDKLFYLTEDKEEIQEIKDEFEYIIRPSTRGGICQAVHTGTYEHCTHIDARSMYPTQAHRDYIPFGGLLRSEPKGPHTYLVAPKGWFRLKPNHIGCIQWATRQQCAMYSWTKVYNPSDYVEDFYLDGTFWIWEAEWEIVKEQYEFINVDDSEKRYIRMMKNRLLKQYVDFLYEGKKKNKGTKRYYFKILLNALYGKFLSRPDGVRITYENGRREKVIEYDRKTYYLPLGSWIAMMGRVSLMRTMMSIPYEDVLYCDTDSCIYKGDHNPDVHIGPELGDWSVEAEDVTVNIVGPKTYQELFTDRSVTTKCAGLSRSVLPSIPFGELKEGNVYTVLKAKRDPETFAINLHEQEFMVNCRARSWRSKY